MSNWAAEGTPTRDPATPTRTGAPATSPAPGGLLLTPSLSLMSRSPTIRASPVMRKSMDLLMARLEACRQQLLDIFECTDIDLSASLDGDEFGLALRLMQRAWPDDEMKAGAAEVSGHGHARGRVSEEETRFAQIPVYGYSTTPQ